VALGFATLVAKVIFVATLVAKVIFVATLVAMPSRFRKKFL
jgi:hypothetical protein